jgi:RHS repeat-associated protein
VLHPYTDWRGQFDVGTCPVVRCSSGNVWFPGATAGAFGDATPPLGGPPSWHGSLIEHGADASGLQYRRNRYYDPVTGRFTQEDPIGISGGLNLYGYAIGDPINYSDPFGLCPKCKKVISAAGVAMIAIPAPDPSDIVPAIVATGALIAWGIWELTNDDAAEQDKPVPQAPNTPRNPDGSAKERGQQYEEITGAQRGARQRGQGDRIQSTRKSQQRDRQEIRDEAEEALEELRNRPKVPDEP